MKVAIAGASGLIGSAVAARLRGGDGGTDGDAPVEVVTLVRPGRANGSDTISYDPEAGAIDPQHLADVDAVVNLAGYSIAGRWNASRKRDIISSRVNATRLLAEASSQLRADGAGPDVLVNASAIGIYGNRGDEVLDENAAAPQPNSASTQAPQSAPTDGPSSGSEPLNPTDGAHFLAEVCRQWEAATQPAIDAGVRVAHARFGLVLAPQAPAVRRLRRLARLGLLGPLGNGKQWWSWVTLHDAARAVEFAVRDGSLRGPFNVVSPEPTQQRDFAKQFAKRLKRPALLPAPAFGVRAGLGQMGQELLLDSVRAQPAALDAAGFAFDHATLGTALDWLLPGKGK